MRQRCEPDRPVHSKMTVYDRARHQDPAARSERQGAHRARRAGSSRRRTRAAIRWSSSAASGAMVEDVDGNVFLDCAAGIAVNSTGHSHPDVVEAIDRAGAAVPAHVGDRLLLRAAGAAGRGARRRSRRSTAACGRSSATPAPKRSRRASSWRATRPAGRTSSRFFGGFHGRTMGALALTASKAVQRRGFGPFMPGVFHAPYPDCYRCPLGARRRTAAPPSASTSSSTSCSCTWSRPTKSRRSSSSRFRAKAATSSRPTSSCSGCAS